MNITLVDGIIITITLMSAILGFARGFTKEILSIISWICGIILAIAVKPFAQSVIPQFFENQLLADGSVLLILLILFLVLFNILSNMLTGIVRSSMLGGVDRSLGVLFGILRGFGVICVLQILMSMFMAPQSYPPLIKENRFFPIIYQGSQTLIEIIPSQIRSYVIEFQTKKTQETSNPRETKASSVRAQEKASEQMSTQAASIAANIAQGIVTNVIAPSLTQQQNFTKDPSSNNHTKTLSNSIEKEASRHSLPYSKTLEQQKAAQKQAEELARLKPKITASSLFPQGQETSSGMTSKQEKALDKFLDTTQDIEETSAFPNDVPASNSTQ